MIEESRRPTIDVGQNGLTAKDNIIETLGELAARHKLVPFLGAGCSVSHLSHDWNSITQALQHKLEEVSMFEPKLFLTYLAERLRRFGKKLDNPSIAEVFQCKFGRAALCDVLRERLFVDAFDDKKGVAMLTVIALGLGLTYSTNQDNVFEQCAAKYGRRFRRIVRLEDLGASAPGECLFIKYHGSLDCPESVIFAGSDYRQRIKSPGHFLNVRMRSDLLSKNFLFIGYSLSNSDADIIRVMNELQRAFPKKLPNSWLVAYRDAGELERRVSRYGVTVVDPQQVCPDGKSAEESFELFLSRLNESTFRHKAKAELANLLTPVVPSARKVVNPIEIQAVAAQIATLSVPDATKLFRAVFDTALIPKNFEDKSLEIFLELARKCATREDSDALTYAAFNLHLSVPRSLEMLAALIATSNVRGNTSADLRDLWLPQVHGVPGNYMRVAIARAVELLEQWRSVISESFRATVAGLYRYYPDTPENARQYVENWVNRAWAGVQSPPNPLTMPQIRFTPFRTFEEITNEMLSRIPHKFPRPPED